MDQSQHILDDFRKRIREATTLDTIRRMAFDVAQFIDGTQRRFGRYMLEVGDPSPEWVARHGRTVLHAVAVGRALARRIEAIGTFGPNGPMGDFKGFPEHTDDDVQRELGEIRASMVAVAVLSCSDAGTVEREHYVDCLYRKLNALDAGGGALARGLASDVLAAVQVRESAVRSGDN